MLFRSTLGVARISLSQYRRILFHLIVLIHNPPIHGKNQKKGSFSLDNFGNEKKQEGFDASRFLNPRQALYKRVRCSGLNNEHIHENKVGVF